MNTPYSQNLKFLSGLKTKTIFSIFLLSLYSCQHLSDEKEASIQKIVETNINFAQKQVDLGKPEEALQALRNLRETFPDNASIFNMMGICYLALSRPAQAKAYFQKAYKKEALTIYALNLSSSLISTGAYVQAQKLLDKTLRDKSYPYKERIFHNYALTFEKRKLYKKAIYYYNKALDENPSYYLSSFRLGKIYLNLNQKQSARKTFETAYHSCQICIEPIRELSLLYLESGEAAKASALLQDFLANKEITKEGRDEAKKLLSLSSKNKYDTN